MRVKICGFTNLDDVTHAISMGCDAIGFIFYKESPRYVTMTKVEEIIHFLPLLLFLLFH